MQPKKNDKLFVKLFIEARKSGLLGTISSRNWKMLCTLATYMNQEGVCNPSQATLARDLGIARQSVSRMIKDLETFRFKGQPVVTIEKDSRYFGGKYGANTYHLLPASCLQIFFNRTHKD